MAYIIFSILTLALVGSYLRNKKTFLNVVLMFGALPFGILMPTLVIGGKSGQAALLLVLFLLLVTASISYIQKMFQVIQKFYLFILFLFVSLFSLMWTDAFGEGLGMTIKYATPLFIIILIMSVVKSQKDLLRCDKSIAISGILLIVLGILNKLTGNAFDYDAKWAGKFVLVAPTMSPAPYSFLLAMCALLSLANYLQTKKKIWLIYFIILYVGVMFAFVRISMAALLFSSMILYGVSKRNIYITYVAPIVSSLIAICAVVFFKPLRDRMFFSGLDVDFSLAFSNFQLFLSYINTSGRTALWQSAFERFKDISIYIGAGSGSTDAWVKDNTGALALHCDFLRVYFDLGLIGLILFLLSHWQLLRKVCSGPKNKENKNIHLKYKSLSVGAMVFYIITLFTDNTLNYVAYIGMYLFAFLGFALFVSISKKSLISPGTNSLKAKKLSTSNV